MPWYTSDSTSGTSADNNWISIDTSSTNSVTVYSAITVDMSNTTDAMSNSIYVDPLDCLLIQQQPVALLNPIDQKIKREHDWIYMMAFRAEQRAIDQAEATALDLVAELFGSGDADWVVVPSKLHPGRVYRVPINDKSMFGSMVRVEENGKLLHKLCAHPSLSLPAGDHAIAKALFLEADEAAFLAVANVH